MRRTAVLIATATARIAAPAALADRDGDGAVRTSRILATLHTELTLPGDGWAQVVGPLARGRTRSSVSTRRSSRCRAAPDAGSTSPSTPRRRAPIRVWESA